MKSSDEKARKKTYHRPKLTVYGNLREITQTSTASGSVKDTTTGKNKSR
jgi:hypothetical protein